MIRHIVMWNLKPHNKEESIGMLKEMLISLKSEIPEIINLSAGKNIDGSEWDMALVMDVESLEALERYKNHPKHKEVAVFSSRVSAEVTRADFKL